MAETVLSAVTSFGSGLADESERSAAAALGSAAVWLGPRRPDPGERAVGYGLVGTIVAVHPVQPLARDRVWRVTLAGEPCGRLVRSEGRRRAGWWSLLQVDDLTDAQLELLDAALAA